MTQKKTQKNSSLVLVRHGQSVWNARNLFTGWRDVDLSDQGREEAQMAGERLLAEGFHFDMAWSSALMRAQKTCEIILQQMGQEDIPCTYDEALNERDYGDLSGSDKDAARQKYGAAQVHQWRRSFSDRPPGGESLEDTYDRVLPYYKKHIWPLWQQGQRILIVAHGNSLRALVMELEKLSPQQIVKIEIPTGQEMIYHLTQQKEIARVRF